MDARLHDDPVLTLPWQTRPLAEIVRLSWPITISMLSYSVMTLVDTLLVSRLGASALAGVGLGGTAAFALLIFSFGLLRGAKTLVSQAIGAGRPEAVGSYLGAAMLLAAGIGIVTIAAGELTAGGLTYVSASAAAAHSASTYLRIRILGAPLALVFVAIREVRYGRGDSRSAMIASVAANVVNVALATAFIYGLGLGVAGAAWATVVAQAVEVGAVAWVQHREGWQVRRTRSEHVRAVLRIGMPTAVQYVLEFGSFALLTILIAALSEVQMAAHQIALQIIHFSFLPAFGISEAVSVLAGQAVGARKSALVYKVARQGLVVAVAYTAACSLALGVGAPWIVSGFTGDPALRSVAVALLYVAALFQVFDGANMVARGALRGTGDVRYPAVVGVVTAWLLTPPLTWLLGYYLGLGALGGWIGLCAEIVLGAAVLWWRLLGGAWARAASETRTALDPAAAE